MNYAIVTENDSSQWKDKTGELYHFPSRYVRLLESGTQVVYYKGRMKDNSFVNKRLSPEPHYFGIARIGRVFPDTKSTKQDYYADIVDFIPFSKEVLAKQEGAYVEAIPDSRVSNYWRDGVRAIDQATFDRIVELSDINIGQISNLNDAYQSSEQGYESSAQQGLEGSKKQRYTSYYERNPKLRHQALSIHGYTCMACNFNFEKAYGEKGKGYIHVHHIKPISDAGEGLVNPATDMIVLCANCHSIVHRDRNNTLSLEELKRLLKSNI